MYHSPQFTVLWKLNFEFFFQLKKKTIFFALHYNFNFLEFKANNDIFIIYLRFLN